MIVSRNSKYTAVSGRTEGISMLKDIHAAIDAGPLAVPHSEYAIIARAIEQLCLLAPPDSRRRKLLVYAWLEVNVVFLQVSRGLPHGLVNPTEW